LAPRCKAGRDDEKNDGKYNSACPHKYAAAGYRRVCPVPIPADDAPRAGGANPDDARADSLADASAGGDLQAVDSSADGVPAVATLQEVSPFARQAFLAALPVSRAVLRVFQAVPQVSLAALRGMTHQVFPVYPVAVPVPAAAGGLETGHSMLQQPGKEEPQQYGRNGVVKNWA
jgi:hypothetical protein